jgi:hypothetical protein
MLLKPDLPDDPDALCAIIVEAQVELDARDTRIADREAQIVGLRTASVEAEAEITRLNAIITALQRHRFGASSEKLDDDQLEFAGERAGTARPCNIRRGSLPVHLNPVEQIVDVESKMRALLRQRPPRHR